MKAAFVAVLIGVAACVGYAVPYPERWNEDLLGMRRDDAWRLLGVPDIDYTEKGFDGWNRNAIFGAWVLVVRYGENEKISGVEKGFSWGFGYLSWDDDYRKQWKRPSTALEDGRAASGPRAAQRERLAR
jgi:hypothetical protein